MFLVDFDTSSSHLWVHSTKCNVPACQSKNEYDASSSSTSKLQSESFPNTETNREYKKMSTEIQSMLQVRKLWRDSRPGFPKISSLHQLPVFQTTSFVFLLSSNSSEFHLGGTNKILYTGSIEYHTIINTSSSSFSSSHSSSSSSRPTFWQLTNASINPPLFRSRRLLFDTIVSPPDAFSDLYDAVPDSEVFDESIDAVPCDASFTWDNGTNWVG